MLHANDSQLSKMLYDIYSNTVNRPTNLVLVVLLSRQLRIFSPEIFFLLDIKNTCRQGKEAKSLY
jgi:hypothetical protein